MKKTICLLLCLVLTLTMLSGFGFCSCDGQIFFRGISTFDTNNSTVEIAYAPYMIGDGEREYVFELYEYIEGDYFYYSMNEMFAACFDTWREMSLLYLTFEEPVYEDAKQFSLKRINTSKEKTYVCDGYTFLVDISPYLNAYPWDFPEHLRIMAFNDKTKTLVFLGFHICYPDENDQKVLDDLINGNIAPFLDEYFVNLLLAKHGVQV